MKLYHVAKNKEVADFIRKNGIVGTKSEDYIVYLTTEPSLSYKKKWFPDRVVFEVDFPQGEDTLNLLDWREVWGEEGNGDDKIYTEGNYCYFGNIPPEKVHEVKDPETLTDSQKNFFRG